MIYFLHFIILRCIKLSKFKVYCSHKKWFKINTKLAQSYHKTTFPKPYFHHFHSLIVIFQSTEILIKKWKGISFPLGSKNRCTKWDCSHWIIWLWLGVNKKATIFQIYSLHWMYISYHISFWFRILRQNILIDF